MPRARTNWQIVNELLGELKVTTDEVKTSDDDVTLGNQIVILNFVLNRASTLRREVIHRLREVRGEEV